MSRQAPAALEGGVSVGGRSVWGKKGCIACGPRRKTSTVRVTLARGPSAVMTHDALKPPPLPSPPEPSAWTAPALAPPPLDTAVSPPWSMLVALSFSSSHASVYTSTFSSTTFVISVSSAASSACIVCVCVRARAAGVRFCVHACVRALGGRIGALGRRCRVALRWCIKGVYRRWASDLSIDSLFLLTTLRE